MTSRPLRVFLCHSSNDKPAVRELYQKLHAETWIRPWLDEEELYPGQDWNMEIEKAIEETDVIIVCLSKSSTTKEGYVQKEIRAALDYADYKPEGMLFIIPVRLEECTPPKRLGRWQYADYFAGEQKRGFQRLFVSLKRRADSLGLIFNETTSSRKVNKEGDPIPNTLLDVFFKKQVIITKKPLEGSKIVLNNELYNISFLTKEASLEYIQRGESYVWVKAYGNSMDAAMPVAIQDHDYVLIYETNMAQHNQIVIASVKDNNDEFFTIKRYKNTTPGPVLFPETFDPDDAEPIFVDNGMKIVGVVIAVAKPV
jgi:hypothetical protein